MGLKQKFSKIKMLFKGLVAGGAAGTGTLIASANVEELEELETAVLSLGSALFSFLWAMLKNWLKNRDN